MAGPITPPRTSSAQAYLLTPPPTTTLDKRILLNDDQFNGNNSLRLVPLYEEDSPASFFDDFNEGSDNEADEKSDSETIPSSGDSSPASPLSRTSPSKGYDDLQQYKLLTSFATTPAVTEPFPFLKLPLALRHKVYEHLLVVPALICVRQKHRIFTDQKGTHLHTERRELTPGIASALPQLSVDGYKVPFSRFATTNSNILLASKEIYAEARAVLYGKNAFEIARPCTEMSPPADFSVRLFPSACQRLITNLSIRIRSFYDLHWLFSGGYNTLKNYYRGLSALTLILELVSTDKGFGRQWARAAGESDKEYVKRLQAEVARGLSGGAKARSAGKVPARIGLRVMFSGEIYKMSDGASSGTEREMLKQGLVEAWESFKKGVR